MFRRVVEMLDGVVLVLIWIKQAFRFMYLQRQALKEAIFVEELLVLEFRIVIN